MDMFAFRALERLVAVIIGGMAVYLGYRLFHAIPHGGDGEARVSLPGEVSIMISRVGPGVFFALFGTLVVAASLYYAIKYDETTRTSPDGVTYTRTLSGIGNAGGGALVRREAVATVEEVAADPQALELERIRLRQEIEFLNRIPHALSAELNEGQRQEAARHLREIKLRLMRSVWGSDWGDPEDFRIWAEGGPEPGDGEAFRRARILYAAGQEDAP